MHWYEDGAKICKKWFEKDFSSWWIMRFSKKIIENVRNHTNIKLRTTEERRNCLESEPMTKKSYKKKKFR